MWQWYCYYNICGHMPDCRVTVWLPNTNLSFAVSDGNTEHQHDVISNMHCCAAGDKCAGTYR